MECFPGCFILEEKTTFIPKWRKEKYQRAIVVFPLSFVFRIKQLVIGKPRLCEFSVLPISIIIFTLPIIVSYKFIDISAPMKNLTDKWIDVSMPHKRNRRLINHKLLQEIEQA